MASVAITRDDLSSAELRMKAAETADAKQARRRLAMAMILDGHLRQLAAQAGGDRRTKGFAGDRQILRDWAHRYNAKRVEGLRDVRNEGRPPALSAGQMQELDDLVLAGPDLARDGVVRWRCTDLRGQIKTRFGVEMHERTVGKSGEALASPMLRRLRMTRLQPRPYHPKRDVAAQKAYRKTLQAL